MAFSDVRDTNDTKTASYDLGHGSIIEGDTLSVLPQLPDDEFHAVVCDPPYNFDDGFMQEDWDDVGTPKEYQEWCCEWAEAAHDTLKPGGHLIAFSGEQSYHRLASGIEDAGYEVRHMIPWIYGNGLPKGPRIERWLDDGYVEEYGDWRGMLKPAIEPALLARAPFSESSSTKNQMEHGTGNLNIEACRLPTSDTTLNTERSNEDTASERYTDDGVTDYANQPGPRGGDDEGRYPPNLALDPVMADLMDMMSGDAGSVLEQDYDGQTQSFDEKNVYGSGGSDGTVTTYADSGGASRFFYCSKASTAERTLGGAVENDHPTVKPLDLMEWLVKMVTAERQKVLDPFAGSGTTLLAADNVGREAVGIEMNAEYAELARERFAANRKS